MPDIKTLLLALFCLSSALHLYASWRDNKRLRGITKPFLLAFLALYALVSSGFRPDLLALALIACWFGDVLLIPKGHGWFTAGGVSFALAHILFILVYLEKVDFASVPYCVVVPVALIYYAAGRCIIRSIRATTPKAMVVPMYVYLIANATMNVFALMLALSTSERGAIIAYVGAVLFFLSDCALFVVRYHAKRDIVPKRHFTVMLTYLLGVLYITLGIAG